jgi:hypothetical protein
MKKKSVKKLTLSKETVKNLESVEADKLQKAHGGLCMSEPQRSCWTMGCW